MKKCLKCNKDFEEKRQTAKFCSTSCRVGYHKKHGGTSATKMQSKTLIEMVSELLDIIKSPEPRPTHIPIYKSDDNKPLSMQDWLIQKRECESEEEYKKWLDRLNADTNLTYKQKKDLKIL